MDPEPFCPADEQLAGFDGGKLPVALARDLRRLLDDDPVEVGPPAAAHRFREFVRRYRSVFRAAAPDRRSSGHGHVGQRVAGRPAGSRTGREAKTR